MLKSKRGKAAEIVACERCGTEFLKEVNQIRRYPHHFCSSKCFHREDTTLTFVCAECGTSVVRQASSGKDTQSGRRFCCRSHAAAFHNRLRRRSRRSKIEAEFFSRLQHAFPNLSMTPNDKEMLLGLETDIAIPSLRLAIEWNGIIHFQPIYGQEKLDLIQQRDRMKTEVAAKMGIRLIIISDIDSKKKTLDRAYHEVHEIISELLTNGQAREI